MPSIATAAATLALASFASSDTTFQVVRVLHTDAGARAYGVPPLACSDSGFLELHPMEPLEPFRYIATECTNADGVLALRAVRTFGYGDDRFYSDISRDPFKGESPALNCTLLSQEGAFNLRSVEDKAICIKNSPGEAPANDNQWIGVGAGVAAVTAAVVGVVAATKRRCAEQREQQQAERLAQQEQPQGPSLDQVVELEPVEVVG